MPLTSFNFTSFTLNDGSIVTKPLVPLRLQYKHKVNPAVVSCLVDSGADINLLPAAWGESVGISIKKGKPFKILGIGTGGVNSYGHKVTFHIDKRIFETFAYFSYEQQTPLLGRDGFFDKYSSVNFKGTTLELGY